MKTKVEEGIKRMVREGVLMPVQDTGNGSVNRGVGFRLGEQVKGREMGRMGEGEGKENRLLGGGGGKGGSSSRKSSGNGYMGVVLGEEEGESGEGGQMSEYFGCGFVVGLC